MQYWLIKSEPQVFSIADLRRAGREPWSGVRNYQARNFMWRAMREDDLAIFYHSNATPPGAAGIARVVGEPYPDPTQWDPSSEYFDPKSPPERPRWWLVDFGFVAEFPRLLALEEMRADPELAEMWILRKGNRLSITPLTAGEFRRVCALAGATAPEASP